MSGAMGLLMTVAEATRILAHPERATEFEIRCARSVVAEHNRHVDAVCDAIAGGVYGGSL